MEETAPRTERGKSALLFFFHFILFSLILAAVAYFFHFTVQEYIAAIVENLRSVEVDMAELPYPVIVLDAGHGGEDGGASGADGTQEKDVNLKVAEMVYEMMRLAGMHPVMVRTTDTMLYDMYSELEDYTGKKKVYDLRNRLRFAKEANAVVFVSIHMNKFPQTSTKGLQVYYSPNDADSQKLAEAIQGYAKQYLQPDNNRDIKKAGSSIYLLKRIQIPAVLIECGFLSNPEECAKLNDEQYLRQLALTISCAVAEFTEYYTNQ